MAIRKILQAAKKRKLLVLVLCVVLALVGADYIVGKKQENFIKAKAERKKHLEKLAFFMIFPDIHDVLILGKEKYEAVIKVDNHADETIYITHPRVKTYVQTGTFWSEVPNEEAEDKERQQIYKLEPRQYQYKFIVNIPRDIKYVPYLLPYYMHVRFHISMFVLPESAFNEEEVVERYTDVYVYLQPFFVDDEDILKEMTFEEVPEFIPMPPH